MLSDEIFATAPTLPPTANYKPPEELEAPSRVKGVKQAEPKEGNRDYLRRITGSSKNTLVLPRLLVSETQGLLSHIEFPNTEDQGFAALDSLEEMNPQNSMEAMLSIQMIGVHHAAFLLLKSANSSQSLEVCDSLVRQSVRLMRLFNEQLEAMAKLKGKTREQKVVVEHVHVNAGGQAIVGAVSTSKIDQGEGGK
jgi:hypothetical protein